jgi:Subtilase family
MGTIGILAGRQAVFAPDPSAKGQQVVSIPQHPIWVGGAPDATVVPVRVAANPVSLGTAALAFGIDYASRVKGCDVISMSHGGSPTQTWVDAVNAAYERGTAMFAAEGDFFSLAPYGFRPGGIVVASSPVYPAAFRRVLGVTGATAEKRSYSGNSLARLFRRLDLLTTWGFRGSYGPDGWLGGINPRVDVDDEEKKFGALRSYPVAGYTPNIAWLAGTQGVDMDGSGTSASTPQVAAAAALWLERNRRAIGRQWHSWQKAEAVYDALLISAERENHRDQPDLYLGAGMLKANRALRWDYARVRGLHSDALKFGRMVKDEFGGAESFWRLLFRAPAHVPEEDRAELNQTDLRGETKETALARMYYNMLLLEKWHGGAIPRHGGDERRLREKGAALARHAIASEGPH